MTAQEMVHVLRMVPVTATRIGEATIVPLHGVQTPAAITVLAWGVKVVCATWAMTDWIVAFHRALTTALDEVCVWQLLELNTTKSDQSLMPNRAITHTSISPRRAACAFMVGVDKIVRRSAVR